MKNDTKMERWGKITETKTGLKKKDSLPLYWCLGNVAAKTKM